MGRGPVSQTLYKRLEPIRKQDPGGTWQSWIAKAFLEKISLSATGFYRGHDLYMDWVKQEGRPYTYFTYAACCSEVELDCLTGGYRGTGEPTLFLGSSMFFALKEAAAAARRDSGLNGPFPLHSPATPERACIACNTHFTQMIPETGTVQSWALELP